MKPVASSLLTLLVSGALLAQDLDVDISSDGISVDTTHWYENPIIWIGFGLLLVVLLVVGLRGKRT